MTLITNYIIIIVVTVTFFSDFSMTIRYHGSSGMYVILDFFELEKCPMLFILSDIGFPLVIGGELISAC